MTHKATLTLATALTVLTLGLTSCNSGSSGSYDSGSSYQETKMTLEDKEKQNPTSFLSTDGTYRKNLLGEWVLEGTISNSATIATYKDVVLEINFYSQTETHLGTEEEAIYEYFPAGKTKNFKIKTWLNGAKKIKLNRFTIPYFHERNGRIGRANRTLRNAINKETGGIKDKFKKSNFKL